MTFSQNELFIFYSDGKTKLCRLDTSTGAIDMKTIPQFGFIWSIAFSPDSTIGFVGG